MLTRNGFKGGMNKDADPSVVPTDFYTDAVNVTLTGDGTFFALENMKGSSVHGSIIASSFAGGSVLGVYENKYTIGTDTNIDCLTVFAAKPGGDFTIWCYRLDTGVSKRLFSQTYTADFQASNPEVDGVTYPENGLDVVYFTDGYNEMRKLRCEIPVGAPDDFLSQQDLSLQRRATLATALYTPQNTGGSLLSGSYQFVFRLYNEDTKAYSRWTIPSWPVNISSAGEGYYGFSTTKKIDVTFRLVDSEIPFWTHFQVGVIENVQAQAQTVASLQSLQALSGGAVTLAGYTDYTYAYKSNDKISSLALTDIVVDLAAIQKVKTLAIKNNRLFAGNIEYFDLQYDRTPTATGSLVVQAVEGAAKAGTAMSDSDSSAYRGYFRDELYRFYIVYWDEFYNLSRPKVLDMTSVGSNAATSGVDYRFTPAQSKQDGSNNYNSLGLSLTIDNHPSWARGFAIFRAKRKKNKIFQSPFVPSIEVSGIDVMGDYPNTAAIDATNNLSLPEATPMNPDGTIMPKPLFHTVAQHIVKRRADDNTTYVGSQREVEGGEVGYQTDNNYSGSAGVNASARRLGFIFEPYYQYGFGVPYTPKASDKLYIADVAFLRLNSTYLNSNTSNTYNDGLRLHGTFYANRSSDYWRDSSTPNPSWPLSTSRSLDIDDYTTLSNFGEGTTFGGADICKFTNLVSPGASLWSEPNNQKMSVLKYEGVRDIVLDSDSFKAGKINSNFKKTANTVLSGSNTATNKMVWEFTAGADGVTYVGDSSIVNAVSIVDIEVGLGDDRYGSTDSLQDMVFTGAQHVFKDSDLATVESTGILPVTVTVFGGDCYVSLHSFKLGDNMFALTNVGKWSGLLGSLTTETTRWKRAFRNKYGAAISMPVAYTGVSQVLSVVIESEVNGEILSKNPYDQSVGGGTSGPPTLNANSLYSIKTPFPYLANQGYSAVSDQKVLIPEANTTVVPNNAYPARVLYSDQKVYNTDISGFDVFRVDNRVDFEETYYGITKLALDGDNLVVLQERATAYLPVDASLLSTTDAATISVRTGSVDLPLYISRIYGCQHMKAVVKSSDAVFFPDNINQRVFRLSGSKLEPISDKGMVKQFRSDFASRCDYLRAMYDNTHAHYIIFGYNLSSPGDFPICYVWDDRLGMWTTRLSINPLDGVFTSSGVFMLDVAGTTLDVHKLYDGDYGTFLARSAQVPAVTFQVNPEFEKNKVFDNIAVYSTNKLDSVDITSNKETGAFGHEALGMIFDYNRREGYYHVPVLRDAHGARIRGTNAEVSLYWPTSNEKITLSQVITHYRESPR